MDPLPALVSVVLTAAIVIPLTIAAVFARQLLRIARSRRASTRLRPGAPRVADHDHGNGNDHDHDHDHDHGNDNGNPAEHEHPER